MSSADKLRLSDVLAYLDACNAKLLGELELAKDCLHRRPPSGWTVAQTVHHLIRAETIMLPIWEVVPKLGRWPKLLTALGRANAGMWRVLGMKTVDGVGDPLAPANAEAGRFRTPIFLDPRRRLFTYSRLVDWRRAVRARTLRALHQLDEETLHRVTWILPHAGPYPLIELARFIGIHEMHHLPQIRRIREL